MKRHGILLPLFVPVCFVFAATALTARGDTKANPPATPAKPASSGAAPQPGHSIHGDVFDEGPRQKAYLMKGMPKIDFPVTTKSHEAQAFFNQGVGQLHGFWNFEAERSFRQTAVLDPQCAMAYWGMAMANIDNPKRAKGMIAKAVELKQPASAREQAWISALSAYLSADDNIERRKQYVRNLEAIVQDNPHDIEAKAFLAAQIWIDAEWMTEAPKRIPIASHQAVDSLLDQVFDGNPLHPAHHYRIHLWDGEKPVRALVSAGLCGQTSPGVAHMWHMPGHIFSDLHRYADAAWQQEAAARTDHAYMMRDGILPDQIHNYAHNNEWLIRDLNSIGRVHDAIDLAKNMIELPRHPRYNMPDHKGSSSHLGRERLVDTLVNYERWTELVALFDSSYLPLLDTPEDRIERAALLGRAHAELGHPDQARKQLVVLEEMLAKERADRYKSADEAESKAKAANKNADEIARLMADALKAHAPRISSLEQSIAEVRGFLALAGGDKNAARAEFGKLKEDEPIHSDQLAQIYSRLGDNSKAENLARGRGESIPGEVYPLATLAFVLQAAGKKTEAAAEFTKLRSLATSADLDQPVFQRLAPLATEAKLPADWRIKQTPTDVGKRPDLATLGPFRWQPTAGPEWSLPQPDGNQIALEHFRGKPVVVLFYLGSGCLHCVEQLKKFSPLASEYSKSGISIVAISSEPMESLKHSLTTLEKGEMINFPLACDADRAVFKKYRAYDDFENMPLHGAFLIDGAGLVRWHDVGYEPFMDAGFLLQESRRLLQQPIAPAK